MSSEQNTLLRLPTPSHSRYTNLLSDIEKGEIKIPQFQREFVWSLQKSAALLDSVIKGYPIGTFIFWATKDRLRSVRDIGGLKLPDPKEGDIVSFILDGQQRITSLFAALKGLIISRSSGSDDDFSKIYVDLDAKPDDQIVITDLTDKDEKKCIRLTDLLYGGLEKLTAYPKAYHETLDAYKQRIQSYDFSIIEVRDVPIDVATEIFTRINVGGVPLALFEIMVAKTYDDKIGFDLLDQIMPTVPTRASISQILLRDDHQAEHVIQFPERQQTSVRGDAGTVELQLEAPVKIEPRNVRFRFTRWVRHDRLARSRIRC